MKSIASLAVLAVLPSALAQMVTVPNECTGSFSAGRDEVYYTVPYTYDQVMSIIGNYSNLTWSGSPENSVTINGTENTVGTARTYDIAGAHVIETILEYMKPAAPGPYVEVHNTALLTIPAAGNLSLYIPFDGTVVSSACSGKASTFNFTASFCSSNATLAGGILHMLHLGDAVTVGKFLGGMNYSSCAALGSNEMGPADQTAPPVAAATATSTGMPSTYTGGAVRYGAGIVGGAVAVVAGVMIM